MKTVYLISPREPSGMAWLYNCLLCLDIKVHYVNPRNNGKMWVFSDGKYSLNPVDDLQKKWAPILTKKEKYEFRNDIQIQFDHIWPTGWQRNQKIIFCIRNPYDSLYSRFKRESRKISFREFLKLPDATTLLDKASTWNLFCEAWLSQRDCANLHIVKFEEYKNNANEVLRSVIAFLEINVSDEQIAFALSQSEFEMATCAEKFYKPTSPPWLKICDDVFFAYEHRKINRSSLLGDSLIIGDDERKYIGLKTSAVCHDLGYETVVGDQATLDYLPQKATLSFFTHLDMPKEWFSDCVDFNEEKYFSKFDELFLYIRDIEALLQLIEQTGLMFGEVAGLIAALQEMQGNYLRLARLKNLNEISINLPRSRAINKIATFSCILHFNRFVRHFLRWVTGGNNK